MTKKHFIALADVIRMANKYPGEAGPVFSRQSIHELADFCKQQNRDFNRDRWVDYIDGECGPNGGIVKQAKG